MVISLFQFKVTNAFVKSLKKQHFLSNTKLKRSLSCTVTRVTYKTNFCQYFKTKKRPPSGGLEKFAI
jgi:hypothetical protein